MVSLDNLYYVIVMITFCPMVIIPCWAWWLSGRFGALCPEGRRFESHCSRHIGTLGKSFTRSCLLRFGLLTLTRYQCCSRERLWVVVDLKRCYIQKLLHLYYCDYLLLLCIPILISSFWRDRETLPRLGSAAMSPYSQKTNDSPMSPVSQGSTLWSQNQGQLVQRRNV